MHYYEVYKITPSGNVDADGIDYKGSCEAIAFDTLEEAIEFADNNENITLISEIGESWTEYGKCGFCGEWYENTELNIEGDCPRCEVAIRDHNGLWERK